MKFSQVSTAAYLAGVTTLAVSLPAFAEQRSYNLCGFDGIAISSGLSAEVEIGPEFTVTAEASSRRTLNRLDIRVRGDTLIVERDRGWLDFSLFAARRDATIRITLPDLKLIRASAGSDVYVSGQYGDSLRAETSSGADLDLDNVSGSSLQFKASSGSDLRAEGACGSLDVTASSGANIRADALICKEIAAHVSSGADISAHATDTVTARASSGGDVRISGSPAVVDKSESSGGDVHLE